MLHERSLHKDIALRASDAERFGYLRKWTIGELFGQAEKLETDGETLSSANLYKSWIACNPGNPLLHAAYFNYGVALAKSGDRLGAINATREGIRLNPDFQPPYINLGRLLEDAGQAGAAIEQWLDLTGRLKEINGESVKNKLTALQQLGRVLESHQLDGPAEDALRQSLDISVAQPEVIQHWIALRQRQCKWPAVAEWDRAPASALMAGISPLSLANLLDDPMFQLARAWKYNREFIKPVQNPRSLPVHSPALRRRTGKLRIGYVSSDLREHAVGFAMTDVFEQHDRDRFEIYAYYCGIDRVDSTRLRIMKSVDHWLDINGLSDEEAAARIGQDEVDILVDLNGYTKDARTRVFSLCPAPIAVNWFGFPGTMGSPYHHYIIADEHIIPQESEIYYSEKVARLSCYQPNDRKRRVAAERPMRSDERLPDDAFVFCCLNGMQKVTPQTFANWMTILAQTPGSVLWLLDGGEETDARVRDLAAQSGVAPERLIFAAKKPNPEHVARYALADLFLDTFPYGAHTTAADAMWMGAPILTTPGKSFASRVCASLANAAGIGELVCAAQEIYVARAIELARNPQRISALKQRLLTGRQSSLLFDTLRLVCDLENLYRGMWEEFQGGRRPVPDLSNLDAYHEIAVALSLEGYRPLEPDEYRRRYQDKLEDRHAIDPIRPDSRLWKNGN
ncbi:MAG: glycosyl transferase [Roseiarcus sp.]|jgi:predicted O-linked N-acetylglucosamine transferase (SPINDLY family)